MNAFRFLKSDNPRLSFDNRNPDYKCTIFVMSIKKVKPDAGLEPATVGLKVQRSTDWANQARKYVQTYVIMFS